MKAWIAALLVVELCACGKDQSSKSGDKSEQAAAAGNGEATAAGGAGEEASSKTFDADLKKKPCQLLKPAMVAKVAGVSEGDLKQKEILGICIYEWGDHGGRVSLGHIYVSKSAKQARERFENAYREMSGEEVKKTMKQLGDRVKKDDNVPAARADKAAKVGGKMGGFFKGGFHYEDVDGVGDEARFDGTRRENDVAGRKIVTYDSDLHVLVGNMKFTLTYKGKDPKRAYKEKATAVAKLVVEALR